MSAIAFRCRLEPEEDGGFTVTFPDLPFGATQGATESEALAEAADCLETILAVLVDEGRDIPEPWKPAPGEHLVSPSAVTAAQVALYKTMRRQGVSADELARRLGMNASEIRNLTDLSSYPALETIERALAVLGHRLTVALDAAE
jgi:antitoxin HicB